MIVLILSALFSLVSGANPSDTCAFLVQMTPYLLELICSACLITGGLYLNYFGRRVFTVFIYLTGAALGAYSSVLLTAIVVSHLEVQSESNLLTVLTGTLGAALGALLLRKFWKCATGAVGAFAGKSAVMISFTLVPEAVYLDSMVRVILIFFGALVGSVLALMFERHAIIVATSIFGTFLALIGYDSLRHLKIKEHLKALLSIQAVDNRLEYLKEMTENQELRVVLLVSVFVIVTGIYVQYRITPKYIDRD